jgi:hypothetical protein
VFLFEVQPDQRGIRDDGAWSSMNGSLPFGRAEKSFRTLLEIQFRELEEHLRLHDEGTGIGQAERGPKV